MKTNESQLVLPSTLDSSHAVIRDMHGVILRLLKEIDFFKNQLKVLEVKIEKVELENRCLRERLNLNSSNSSQPPSSDKKTSKKKKIGGKKSSGKRSGGQPGHPGAFRELLASSEVDEQVFCALDEVCSNCGEAAVKDSGKYRRHQVHELPKIQLKVTEYQLAKGQCAACRRNHVADLPTGVPTGITGTRLTSFMSILVSDYQLSRRQLKQFLTDHFHFKVSLGTVFNKQRFVTTLLENPVKALLPRIKSNPCNMDETSHRRDGQRHWLWPQRKPRILK